MYYTYCNYEFNYNHVMQDLNIDDIISNNSLRDILYTPGKWPKYRDPKSINENITLKFFWILSICMTDNRQIVKDVLILYEFRL